MRPIIFILLFWLCLNSLQGQDELSYEVNSIFPRHLLDKVDQSHHSIDGNGYFWNVSEIGIQCFDGEKLISYNNRFESGDLSITTVGNGYVWGTMIQDRYYWAIERSTYHLICFDTDSRRLIKRFIPPDNKIYYTTRKDEKENLFVLRTTRAVSYTHLTLPTTPYV